VIQALLFGAGAASPSATQLRLVVHSTVAGTEPRLKLFGAYAAKGCA